MLISFAVTAQLIFTFVFAYADCWFSGVDAHTGGGGGGGGGGCLLPAP